MRRFLATLLVIGMTIAACGGSATTPAPPGTTPAAPGATPAAPGATPVGPAATPAAPPPVGGGTVTVVLTGGPDAGTYTGALNPNCTVGAAGEGVWGTQYSTDTAGAGQLSSVQTVIPATGSTDSEFMMTITIGKLFEGNDYEITSRDDGDGKAQVTDAGTTAVIHATGTTSDGVAVDATVNCPSVLRF